jgi:hypothetical protein
MRRPALERLYDHGPTNQKAGVAQSRHKGSSAAHDKIPFPLIMHTPPFRRCFLAFAHQLLFRLDERES